METWEWIVLVAVAAAVVLLGIGIFARARSRSRRLEGTFGPEYDRAVSNTGRRDAERHLSDVEKQHEDLRIRALPGSARERYLEEWKHAETRFVTDPRESAASAERIIRHVLEERGYPTDGDTEDQVAHLGGRECRGDRLVISHLTDEDDVRILTHYVPQRVGI